MSVVSGITNLINGIFSIIMGIFNSILAIFQSLLGVAVAIVNSVLELTLAILNFMWSNIGVILTIGLALCAYQIFVVDGKRPNSRGMKKQL